MRERGIRLVTQGKGVGQGFFFSPLWGVHRLKKVIHSAFVPYREKSQPRKLFLRYAHVSKVSRPVAKGLQRDNLGTRAAYVPACATQAVTGW